MQHLNAVENITTCVASGFMLVLLLGAVKLMSTLVSLAILLHFLLFRSLCINMHLFSIYASYSQMLCTVLFFLLFHRQIYTSQLSNNYLHGKQFFLIFCCVSWPCYSLDTAIFILEKAFLLF